MPYRVTDTPNIGYSWRYVAPLGAYGFSLCEYDKYVVVRFLSLNAVQKGSRVSFKGNRHIYWCLMMTLHKCEHAIYLDGDSLYANCIRMIAQVIQHII